MEDQNINWLKKVTSDPAVFRAFNEKRRASDRMRLHAEPTEQLIDQMFLVKFPSEPDQIRDYRKSIFGIFTKSYFDKIYDLLFKLQSSSDFYINYPINDFPAWLADQNVDWNNAIDYAFKNCLYTTLVDPNAVWIYFRGEGKIILSKDILYFSQSQAIFIFKYYADQDDIDNPMYVVVYFGGYSIYTRSKNAYQEDSWVKIEDSSVWFMWNYVVPLPGKQAGLHKNWQVSLIDGIADPFKAALIAENDLSCALKQHIFPQKYRYVDTNCIPCDGSGRVTYSDFNGQTQSTTCGTCKGTGRPPTGIFAETQISVSSGNTLEDVAKVPNPPMGYITMETDSVAFIRERYYDCIKEGLAAISMEFLQDSGVNQSGVSKKMDRAEFNMFLGSFCLKMKGFIEKLCFAQTTIFVVQNYAFDFDQPIDYTTAGQMIKERVPVVHIPLRFESLYFETTIDDLATLRQAGVSPTIMREFERELVASDKKTNYILDLDPLYGYTFEQKMQMFEADLVSKLDLFVSLHIDSLINEIVLSEPDFLNRKNMKIVSEKIYKLAEQKL